MCAAFRPVHATALGAVAVVQKLGRQTSQHGAFLRLELEGGHCGSVLAEVNHECLARTDGHEFAGSELLHDADLAVLLVGCACRTFPCVGLDGRQSEVPTMINLCAARRPNLSGEFLIDFRLAERAGTRPSLGLTGIIVLAVEDGSVCDGTCHASLPVLQVRGEMLLGAVGVGQREHASEGNFLAYHALMSPGGDNLVCPPAGHNLHGELVFLSRATVEGLRDVVSKAVLRLLVVREAGLQDLVADKISIDVKLVGAQGGGLPDSPLHLLRIAGIADEPACAVGSPVAILHFARDDLGILGANPDRFVPGLDQMIVDEFADSVLRTGSKSCPHHAPEKGDSQKILCLVHSSFVFDLCFYLEDKGRAFCYNTG